MISRRRRRGPTRVVAMTAVSFLAAGLTACSSGQLTQTAEQVPPITGANANAGPNNEIALRNLVVVYNDTQGYQVGASAPLVVRIFNTGVSAVTLVGVSAPAVATAVTLVGGQPPAQPSPAEPSPTVSPSGSPSATPPPAQTGLSIRIAPSSYVLLVPGQGPYLQLTGLTQALIPGSSVELTFTFANGVAATVAVPFGLPTAPAPRPSALPEEHAP